MFWLLADVAVPSPTGAAWQAAYAALVAVVSAVGAAAAWYISHKTATSKLWTGLDKVWQLAMAVVAHVDAKLRPQLESALADGVLTPDERKTLQEEALRLFKEGLGDEGMAAVKAALGVAAGGLDVALSGVLERAYTAFRGAKALAPAVTGASGDLLRGTKAPPVAPAPHFDITRTPDGNVVAVKRDESGAVKVTSP